MKVSGWEYLFATMSESEVCVGEALKDGLSKSGRWTELDDIFRILAHDDYNELTGLLYGAFETTYMQRSGYSAYPTQTQIVETLSVAIANYRAARTPLVKLASWRYSGRAAFYSGDALNETGPSIQDLLMRSTEPGSPYQGSIYGGQLHFFNLEHALDVIGKANWEMVAIDPVAYGAADHTHFVFKRLFDASQRDWENPYNGETDDEFFPTIAFFRASRESRR